MKPSFRLIAGACLALVVLALVAGGWNSFAKHIPFTSQWRAERAENRADTAESDAAARRLEVEGGQAQAQRVETYHTQVVEVRDMTSRAETEARSAPDANEPLPADRAARIERNTDSLCDARPRVCGPTPADAS